MATRSRITHRSSSVPVSTVTSVLMSLPFALFFSLVTRRVGKAKRAHHSVIGVRWWARRWRLCPPYDSCMTSVILKLLHPGPQLELPAPGAARLLQHVPVAERNRVGIEHRI